MTYHLDASEAGPVAGERAVVAEGDLVVGEIGGELGGLPDRIEVGGEALAILIGRLFGIAPGARGSVGEFMHLGRARIIVERLDR